MRGEHFTLAQGQTLAQRLIVELSRPDYFNRQINQAYVMTDLPSTLLPLENFRREEAASVYRFAVGSAFQNVRVAYSIMPHLETVEVFGIQPDVEEAILQFYPTARFFGTQAMLLERLMRHETETVATGDTSHRLYCLTAPLRLYAITDGRITFANSFDTASVADAAFFTLAVWKQLGLDALTDTLQLLAPHPSNPSNPSTPSNPSNPSTPSTPSNLIQELAPYLANIAVLKPQELFVGAPLSKEQQLPLPLMALLLNRY